MLRTEDNHADNRHEQFLRLFLPLRHRLHRFACALTGSGEEARDLTADTILAALEGYDPMRPEETFRSYLFTIAIRLHRRGKKRRERIRRLEETEEENVPGRFSPPDIGVDVRALREAMSRLPRRQQEAVALFELSGMSLNEIHEIQGGSLSGVKSRVVRGRKRLAELLGAENDLELPPISAKERERYMIHTKDGKASSPLTERNSLPLPLNIGNRE